METVDEIQQLKSELNALQKELGEVREAGKILVEKKRVQEETAILNEYLAILGGWSVDGQQFQPAVNNNSSGGCAGGEKKRKSGFPNLLNNLTGSEGIFEEDCDFKDEDSPDSFAFMGLVQASMTDSLAIRALAMKLPFVKNLTVHNIEELLQLIPRLMVDRASQREFLRLVAARLKKEIQIRGTWKTSSSLFASIAMVYGNWDLSREDGNDMMILICPEALSNMGSWPAHHQAEIAVFVGTCPISSEAKSEYLEGLHKWLREQPFNEELHLPRVIWQILYALRKGGVEISANLASQLTVGAERAIAKPLIGLYRNPSDLHYLAIELAAVKAKGTGSLWTSLVEKLTHGFPAIYEVPGTLSACTSMGYTHDNLLLSNAGALKRHLPKLSQPEDIKELADAIVLCGDRTNSIARSLYEKRSVIEKSPESLWSLLASSAVAAVESGTAISEATIILKKSGEQILNQLVGSGDEEQKLLVFLCLLPNSPLIPALATSAVETNFKRSSQAAVKLRDCIKLLGYDDCEFEYCMDGLYIDAAFPQQKTAIIVEPHALYNVSSKRYQGTGWTTLKMNILTQRKGWKVSVFIPDTYADEKSIVSFVQDTFKKIAYSAVVRVEGVNDVKKVSTGQRMKALQLCRLSMPEISRLLLSVLRSNVVFDSLEFSDCSLTDNMTEVLSEFTLTYLSKYPLNKLDLSGNLFSNTFLQRLFHAVRQCPVVNRVIEIDVTGNQKMERLDECASWPESTNIRLFVGQTRPEVPPAFPPYVGDPALAPTITVYLVL